MNITLQNKVIPTKLTEEQFIEFFWKPSFSSKKSKLKISEYKYFCYILKFLYTGWQWKELVIEKDENGNPEIHYTSIFRRFKVWNEDGVWIKSFGRETVTSVSVSN